MRGDREGECVCICACVGDKTRNTHTFVSRHFTQGNNNKKKLNQKIKQKNMQKKSNEKICTYSTTADVEMVLRVESLRDSWKNGVGTLVAARVRIGRSCCMWYCGIWHFADQYLLAACVLHT